MSSTVGRIPVLDIWPVVSGGLRPAKAVVGEAIPVAATVFREGHDAVSADVILTDPAGVPVGRHRMTLVGEGTDRYQAVLEFPSTGLWFFTIEAWSDPVATWLHRVHIKVPAGLDVELEFREGAVVIDRVLANAEASDAAVLISLREDLLNGSLPAAHRLERVDAATVQAALNRNPVRDFSSRYGPFPMRVERTRALFGSWYEFFPRSEGAVRGKDGTWKSGTLASAAQRLPALAQMGFDVVYLPPIHPIGTSHRKGRNNSLTAQPGDPGSPWAVGSSAGGHDAIHPDLGTEKDFTAFVATARQLDMEVALDLALQASPDHPWVSSHPEWFTTRADGTIAFAENPPKKYQDIYPLNFDNDPDGIFSEIERIIRFWMERGVRIFRVDNPHTKPVDFWERMLAAISATDPDVIFLAEAFTRPAMMRMLGEVGFQQSYTYFTWRNGKQEITDYLTELSGFAAPFFRPNFFVNTPDILPEYLQLGGPNAFAIRALLAATLSPTWGVYSGFELYEYIAVRAGAEEYLDSEKYEYRPRDWEAAHKSGTTLAPFITQLNMIRRHHPALQQLRDITFHRTDSDAMLCYSKRSGDDVVLVVVTVDPAIAREGGVHLNMPALGLDWQDTFTVRDELSGATMTLQEHNSMALDPHRACGHIFTIVAAPR